MTTWLRWAGAVQSGCTPDVPQNGRTCWCCCGSPCLCVACLLFRRVKGTKPLPAKKHFWPDIFFNLLQNCRALCARPSRTAKLYFSVPVERKTVFRPSVRSGPSVRPSRPVRPVRKEMRKSWHAFPVNLLISFTQRIVQKKNYSNNNYLKTSTPKQLNIP